MELSADLGDVQGGIAPLFPPAEGASDIQRMVIGRALAG